MTENLRIIFMGTPEFAVAPLRELHRAGYHIPAVVTAPDRPAGRGKKMRASAVKEYAVQHGIRVLQPEKLRDPAFLRALDELKPDLQVVVAFRMLPEAVWRKAPMGTFNLHASLLPQYRGAAPVNHVLINGENRTGVTSFLIDEQIDTGNILLRKECEIGPGENAGQLHDRLMSMGAGLVLETVQGLQAGSLKARSQQEWMEEGEILKPAPKIHKADCRINWKQEGKTIFNLIRGLSPYPAAFTSLVREDGENLLVKIYECAFLEAGHDLEAGTVVTDGKSRLEVACGDGFIEISVLQQEGKRRMETAEFLRGLRPSSTGGPLRFS